MIYQATFTIALALLGLAPLSHCADRCRGDLTALNKSPAEALSRAIEMLAEFELFEVNKTDQPSSARQGLQESLDAKITKLAKRARIPEDEIRQRILRAKQILFFSPPGARKAPTNALQRELESLPPVFAVEQTLTNPQEFRVNAMLFSPDGKLLTAGDFDGRIRQIPWKEGGEVKVFDGHSTTISSLATSADGRRILSGSFDNTARIWDVAGKKKSVVLSGHDLTVQAVALSADGKIAVTGSIDTTLRIWNAVSGKQLHKLGARGSYSAVAISPDARFVASDWNTSDIRLVDVKSGKRWGKLLKGHSESIASLAVSPDGKLLASGSADHSVRIWNIAKRELAVIPMVHGGPVHSVAFSADGKYLVSGSDDFTAKVWNVETGALAQVLRNTVAVEQAVFSPDGERIAILAGDTVTLWKKSAFGEKDP